MTENRYEQLMALNIKTVAMLLYIVLASKGSEQICDITNICVMRMQLNNVVHLRSMH